MNGHHGDGRGVVNDPLAALHIPLFHAVPDDAVKPRVRGTGEHRIDAALPQESAQLFDDGKVDIALFHARRKPQNAAVDAAVPRVEHDGEPPLRIRRGGEPAKEDPARKQETEPDGKKEFPFPFHTFYDMKGALAI